jgi:YD repeat-containing protein
MGEGDGLVLAAVQPGETARHHADLYDIGSNLLSVTDPRAITTSYAYDALDRMTQRTDAFGYPSTIYDSESNVLTVTDPRGVTMSYAYDALNRLVLQTDASSYPSTLPALNHASPITSFVYDAVDNLLSTTDPRGVTTSYVYDRLDRRVTEIDAFSYPSTLPALNHASPATTFLYDANDNLLSTTDPRGVTSSFVYDALNRMAERIDAFSYPSTLPALGHASPITTYLYDINSNLLSTTDPRGVTTSYVYDAPDRWITTIDAFSYPIVRYRKPAAVISSRRVAMHAMTPSQIRPKTRHGAQTFPVRYCANKAIATGAANSVPKIR